MLLDARSDRKFQRYLDVMEQRLHVALFPVLVAGVRLQVNRNHVQAQGYVQKRGTPILLRHMRQVYRDQYESVDETLRQEKAATGLSNFMRAQIDYMQAEAARKIVGISRNLSDEIAALVLRMVQQGKSNQRIQAELRKLAPEFSKGRSARIARTETHNAAMHAQEAIVKFRKIPVATKTWMTAGDEKVRPSHQGVGGTTIPYEEAFSVGGSQMMFPGDQSMGAGAEEVVNCRCSLLYHRAGAGATPAAEGPPEELPGTVADRRTSSAAAAKAYVLDEGRSSGVEHLRWIDYATGELTTDANSGTKGEVFFTDALVAAISDTARSIELHHNHPSDSSFSPQDIKMLGKYPGLSRMFAHGHRGSSYLASDAKPGAGALLDRALNTYERTIQAQDFGSERLQVLTHAGMLALERGGWVKYEYELTPSREATIRNNPINFQGLVNGMSRMIGVAKAIRVGAFHSDAPGLIDPPIGSDDIAEWEEFLDDLEAARRRGIPHLGPFIRRARAEVARLR